MDGRRLADLNGRERTSVRMDKQAKSPTMNRSSLTRFAWLSIAAAILTIGLKAAAYLITGSVGLLSDALESLVNLVGAVMALAMLTIAARPADDDHAYGHSKAEYFSSGVEGTLIVLAAISIAVTAIPRLFHPKSLEQVGLGLAVSVAAALVNLGVALVLLRAAKQHQSITLKANAHHLLTDVWTSVGVLTGVGAVVLTGWQRLDPVVALIVAGNIVWSGFCIVRDSVAGLLDTSIPPEELKSVRDIIDRFSSLHGIECHDIRTRQAGNSRFVSLHVLVPGTWTVHRGHELAERIESDIRGALGDAEVITHLESLDGPASSESGSRRARVPTISGEKPETRRSPEERH
jgi:cation diffusion facilitator family transporter